MALSGADNDTFHDDGEFDMFIRQNDDNIDQSFMIDATSARLPLLGMHGTDMNASQTFGQYSETLDRSVLGLEASHVTLQDSVCSWTGNDDEEKWYHEIQDKLSIFRGNAHQISMLTPALNTRQRKTVHAMCHMNQLSHMSLPAERDKRILITKCELKSADRKYELDKVWNPSRGHWKSGYVDPKIVVFKNVPAHMTATSFDLGLALAGLPRPRQTTESMPRWGDASRFRTVYALFDEPVGAAEVLAKADGIVIDGVACIDKTAAEYLHLPAGFKPRSNELESLFQLVKAVFEQDFNAEDEMIPPTSENPGGLTGQFGFELNTPVPGAQPIPGAQPTGGNDNASFDLTQVNETGFASINVVPAEMHVITEASEIERANGSWDGMSGPTYVSEFLMARNSCTDSSNSDSLNDSGNTSNNGYTSATSAMSNGGISFVQSHYGSDSSVAKRQKAGQFHCESCSREFRRQCDLNKHSKIHGEPTHNCLNCGMGFHEAKDLRRHHGRKHRNVLDGE